MKNDWLVMLLEYIRFWNKPQNPTNPPTLCQTWNVKRTLPQRHTMAIELGVNKKITSSILYPYNKHRNKSQFLGWLLFDVSVSLWIQYIMLRFWWINPNFPCFFPNSSLIGCGLSFQWTSWKENSPVILGWSMYWDG